MSWRTGFQSQGNFPIQPGDLPSKSPRLGAYLYVPSLREISTHLLLTDDHVFLAAEEARASWVYAHFQHQSMWQIRP